ncbi:MAG TPA: hypothetical protein VGZ28_12155 [Terriglobales bacterium]|jgi:uncharacterized protein (DUF486 family)|nr:hypothetical protein [Terriglobales bacterium]
MEKIHRLRQHSQYDHDRAAKWNYVVGFVLIAAAVFVIFKKW